MMKLLQSCSIAFSMYSRIPMPRTEWNQENMKYAMCFFPLVGAVIGGIVLFVSKILLYFNVSDLFYSVTLTLLPVIVTGGIHMDGFMDTSDALGSYGSKEKKLEILKDPHTGAFAVLGAVGYLMLQAALWSEAGENAMLPAAAGYILSRAMSGYAVAAFTPARDSGLASTFHNGAHRNVVKATMAGYAVFVIGALMFYNPWMAAAEVVCAGAAFSLHVHNCRNVFGGITGDLAGYFLQICELFILAGVVLAGHVLG